MNKVAISILGALVVVMLAASTLFVVDQRQVGVVYALGEIKEVISEPGLKLKLPPPGGSLARRSFYFTMPVVYRLK